VRRDFETDRQKRHDDNDAVWEDREFRFAGKNLRYLANPKYQATKSLVEVTEGTAGTKVFSIVEDAVLAMLEPDCRDEFLDGVENAELPVTWEDLIQLAFWLVEETSNRPTGRSQSSTDGSSGNGTASTATSSTEPGVVSAG
jgi:hypothetical protein